MLRKTTRRRNAKGHTRKMRKKLKDWVKSQIPVKGNHSVRRVKKSTSWIRAKAVRVVRKAGRTVVQVKR